MARESRLGTSWMSRFVAIMALPLALHALYATGQKAVDSFHLSQQAGAMQAEIDQLRQENLRLQRDIQSSRSDVEVERLAREQLGLVRPGDHALSLLEGDGRLASPPAPNTRQDARTRESDEMPTWKQWWRFFFGPRRE